MQVEMVGVLFDRCGKQPGSALGPDAIRYAFERHERRDVRVQYRSRVAGWRYVHTDAEIEQSRGLRSFNQAVRCYLRLQQEVAGVLGRGNMPVVLGGDHSIALGSIPVIDKHIRAQGGKLAVLWIDAHADLNSPATSRTGNLHGMPLGAMCGRESPTNCRDQWRKILDEVVVEKLDESQIAWLGLRDVDLPEAKFIAQKMPNSLPITMEFIDRYGLTAAYEKFKKWFDNSGCTHLWLSFDVDVFDPVLAPGTGTAVRGGLTYREGHLLAEYLCQDFSEKLAGLDIVEVNPILDSNNTTVRVAVEWMSSLFGKKILPWGPHLEP